jgi:hypothetical protein
MSCVKQKGTPSCTGAAQSQSTANIWEIFLLPYFVRCCQCLFKECVCNVISQLRRVRTRCMCICLLILIAVDLLTVRYDISSTALKPDLTLKGIFVNEVVEIDFHNLSRIFKIYILNVKKIVFVAC